MPRYSRLLLDLLAGMHVGRQAKRFRASEMKPWPATPRPPDKLIDVLSSRVRATYFAVSLTIQSFNPSAKSEAREQETLHDVAEQVAGALY